MKKVFKSLLGATIVSLAMITSSTASAENLTIREGQAGEPIIQFEGGYIKGTAKRLKQIAEISGAKVVEFNSSGGYAEEGYMAHDVMLELGLSGFVPRGKTCMSACAVTFLGAKHKDIQGVLGFHPSYIDGTAPDEFKLGQIDGMNETFFLLENGVSGQFIRAFMYLGKPSVFAVFTDNDEFSKIFDGSFTDVELIDLFWSLEEIKAYRWLVNGGTFND